MMSEERHRLHWITAVIELVKTLKEAILPLIVIVVANGLGREKTGNFWLDNISVFIFGLFIVFTAVAGLIKWKRFVYWFEDGELRIEHGLFVKKKRYIPFERIQSLDYTEGIFHRPFGLVKVKVETAGGSGKDQAEAELTAVTRAEADRVSREIADAKRMKRMPSAEAAETTGTEAEGVPPEVPEADGAPARTVFRMENRDIVFLSAISGRIGLIFSGMAVLMSQFSDILPYELIFDELAAFVKFGVLIIAAAVLAVLLVGWVISVVWTFLSFYGFQVAFDGDDLFISRGLLEKKRITVPLNRIQAVRMSENPFQKLFGYRSVKVHSAGGGEESGAVISLFPLVKRDRVNALLGELFPELDLDAELARTPGRSRPYFYRIDFVWMIPVIGLASWFLFPYGLLTLLIVPAVILLGMWQHRSGGWAISGRQLTVRWRGFALQTVYVFRRRIQSMEERQTVFQKRKDVATVNVSFKSGTGASVAPVRHIDRADAERLMDWYDPRDRTGREAALEKGRAVHE
ncbi:PH domain-containing protein [Edaphobacillus lindanitolerans]|uniref:Putative membrane protein n=1 Tax=Edaphobacillus lindanitolerans TaxID=550447 RepID=A0A1U7PPD4_9BACI|nr:PH domain-containing protein [Edaphobacillus lindanitolerans]SIT89597.1 putative membrane protein [Edaphobacillus lindanitolerans]